MTRVLPSLATVLLFVHACGDKKEEPDAAALPDIAERADTAHLSKDTGQEDVPDVDEAPRCQCTPHQVCLEDGSCCTPNCDNFTCVKQGEDGCGGTCGICKNGTTCIDGKCRSPPYCGDNYCDTQQGESCDLCVKDCACKAGRVCVESACCQPNCDGKQCGPDDCGGSCGNCPNNASCRGGSCGS